MKGHPPVPLTNRDKLVPSGELQIVFSPEELPRPSWDRVWMDMAIIIGRRSRCSRAKVGCVIVSTDQEVLSASYNGPPPNYRLAQEGPCSGWCSRAMGHDDLGSNYDSCPSAHAEANGIARADHSRTSGSTAYVSHACCITCAKLLAATGVARVVHMVRSSDAHRNPDATEAFLRDCGLVVDRWVQ